MSSRFRHNKRSASFIYKIYRRLRYIRFKKKHLKKARKENIRKKRQESQEHRMLLNEFKISERQARQLKIKAEREENRRLKKELKAEFRHLNKIARQEWQALSLKEKENKRLALKEEKKERKRTLRKILRSRSKNFSHFLYILNIKTLNSNLKAIRDNAPERRQFFLIASNSTVLFLLSYFSLFLFSQFITVVAARFFDYPTTVYYYNIYFNINQESWFHDSVKTIFASGPVINFVIGITSLFIYINIRETTGSFKLYFLWGFLHAANMLFGALLVGTLFETGVGHVISWMYIMDSGRVFYSIISIFLLVVAGLITTKSFLISGNTYFNEINDQNRTSFMIAQVLMPYLAGNALLFLIRQPRFIYYDTFIALTLIISILPILVTFKSYNELYFEEEEKKPRLLWIGIALLTLVVFFFRGVLEIGIRFSG